MRYETFSLRIGPGPGSSYAVSVQSPQGEGHGIFAIPRSGGTHLSKEELPGHSGDFRHLALSLPGVEAPGLHAGRELFLALFQGEVANLFHASLGSIQGRQQGLRIEIAINPRCPELAPLQTLPWELLCRPETEDFLCLSRRTPVIRSLEIPRERREAIPHPGRLRILVVAASPVDCPGLDLARERRNLQEAWKGQERKVEVVFLDRGGLEQMRQAFLAEPFDILHFMGHGEPDEESGQGVLLFEREDRTSQPLEGRRLAQLLQDFERLRLVVLNACHTAQAVATRGVNPFAGVASSLVMGGLPAVVAMTGPIPDLAAVAFSRTFYQRLAIGDSVEAALTEGRLAIQRATPVDSTWAMPALFLRSPDGMLFAPRSTVWARRVALLAVMAVVLTVVSILAAGWLREHRAAQVTRLISQGIGFLELGRQEEALDAFHSALIVDPKSAEAQGNLAVLEMQLGDDEKALEHAQAAVQAAPEEAVHHYNLGNLLALKKRPEEAISSLQRAIELDPCYAQALNELGNVYLELEHLVEARKAFEAGLMCDQTLAKLHKNLGRAALTEGHPEEAILHLEKALALYSPADPSGRHEAMYWLAAAQTAAGRTTDACETLHRFEVLDPDRLSLFAEEAMLLARKHGCP